MVVAQDALHGARVGETNYPALTVASVFSHLIVLTETCTEFKGLTSTAMKMKNELYKNKTYECL